MKIKNIIILISISAIMLNTAWFANALDIDSCGILGFVQETYTLTTNVSTSESTCFTVTAQDVTLNCNGFSIQVDNESNANSDLNNPNVNSIYSNQSNTVLQNCDESLMIIHNENNNHVIYSTLSNSTKLSNGPSRRALFDIIADIVTEPKKSGEDLIVKVSLVNFGASNKIDANLRYTITDSKGIIIKQYAKTIPVVTQTEFLDHVNTTTFTNGKYTLKIELIYDGQTFPASTEKVFYVGAINEFFKNTNIKTFLLPAITVILLVGVYRKSRINKLKENSFDNTFDNTFNKSFNNTFDNSTKNIENNNINNIVNTDNQNKDNTKKI